MRSYLLTVKGFPQASQSLDTSSSPVALRHADLQALEQKRLLWLPMNRFPQRSHPNSILGKLPNPIAAAFRTAQARPSVDECQAAAAGRMRAICSASDPIS